MVRKEGKCQFDFSFYIICNIFRKNVDLVELKRLGLVIPRGEVMSLREVGTSIGSRKDVHNFLVNG